MPQFLNYLNSKHNNITFTSEMETGNKLPFLDLIVERKDGRLVFSVLENLHFRGQVPAFLAFAALNSK